MALSGRRLVAVVAAALLAGSGAGLAASAEAKPRGGKHARARAKAKAARPRGASAATRVRAVKVGTGSGWVPADALGAQLSPLTGTIATDAAATMPGTGAPEDAGVPATTPTAASPGDAPPSVQAVGVTVDDRAGYSARLSRPSIAAGETVVQLVNRGEDDHNLRVVPTDHAGAAVDFPLTSSGANATRTLILTPGSYRLFCTLTAPVNHETAGMNATLRVTAPAS